MPDTLISSFEQRILERQLLPLASPWAGEVVYPQYDGLSIRNLPHTVMRLLNGNTQNGGPGSLNPQNGTLGSAPLDSTLWRPYAGRVKRVVLFITDGLGWQLLQEIAATDPSFAQVIADLTGDGTLTPLTSIAPTTTASALPTIWCGATPIATGLLGTQLFLREYSTLASMLHFAPVAGKHRADALEDWGLDLTTLLPQKTLSEALRQHRIPSYLLLQKDMIGSGLSRVMHRGVENVIRHVGYTDLWINLRDLLRETRRQRCFINVYWAAVDMVSHIYGTAAEQVMVEIGRQLADLRDVLCAGDAADGQTLFMLVADHGHSPITEYVNIYDHAPLSEALRCGLGGQARLANLYLREGYREQVEDYFRERLPDQFITVRPADAQAAGLFGTETPHPEAGARMGDLIVIAREGFALTEKRPGAMASVSRHGGLSAREMIVPLLMRTL